MIQTGPMTTVQDFGRFGYRRYGIPQSGAMDKEWMITANQMVGNPDHFPVVEFAISGIKIEALADTSIAILGAQVKLNDKELSESYAKLSQGDLIEIAPPAHVYAYIAIGGKLHTKEDFGSYSTYIRAGFGGINGREIGKGDLLKTSGRTGKRQDISPPEKSLENLVGINIMKGPEWDLLKELPSLITFKVDSSSDRMSVRLTGAKLDCDYHEIASSAVIPGIIQLPPDGQPIVLMNDCQTTGGYPRIGKVLKEDMGKLAQLKPGKEIKLVLENS